MRKKEQGEQSPQSAGQKGYIPKFDLAEQIMSRQRRETATRRTGPGVKKPTVQHTGVAGSAIFGQVPLLAEQQKIVAEIVARDIERLSGGSQNS